MEENTLTQPVEPSPPVIRYQGVDYVPARYAEKYLDVDYTTIHNLIKSRARYLVAIKIGATLFVTVDSLEAEKARREAAAKTEVAA